MCLVLNMIILRAFFHHIYFLVIALLNKTRCQGDCDNNGLTSSGGGCCANYHMVNGSCQVCPLGYFGSNCTVQCYYPTFGKLCEQECRCDPSDCDHMYGCKSDDGVFDITPSEQPQQKVKQQSESVTDPINTYRNRFAGDCDNDKIQSGGGCCSNYHIVNGRCKACPVGYFGSNCGVPCGFPSFGQFCLSECNCSESECDHRYGCKKDESTVPVKTAIQSNSSSRIVTSHRFTDPTITTYHPSITNPSIEFNSTTLTLIIGGIVIFFLTVIIIFQIYERNCKNRERKLPAAHVQRSKYEDTAEPVYCDIDDRYETMETNSPPAAHKKEDIPLIEVASDPQLVPLVPLKKDPTRSSGPCWEESSDEKSTEPEVSSSNSTSSSGSYLKPVTTKNKHKYAKIIDSTDGDRIVCIESSENSDVEINASPTHDAENETVIGVLSKDNPYLDVIHN